MDVAVVHPGEMGAAVGAALIEAGHTVRWAGDGRSVETTARADAGGLINVRNLASVMAASDVVVALCPPHAALDVAAAVFAGTLPDGFHKAAEVFGKVPRHQPSDQLGATTAAEAGNFKKPGML